MHIGRSFFPFETGFPGARANLANTLSQPCDFARTYDEPQALDGETKAQVDQKMIVEENKVLEQEHLTIVTDWRGYYPNQFYANGLPLVNTPTPLIVDSLPISPASLLFASPKMTPAP